MFYSPTERGVTVLPRGTEKTGLMTLLVTINQRTVEIGGMMNATHPVTLNVIDTHPEGRTLIAPRETGEMTPIVTDTHPEGVTLNVTDIHEGTMVHVTLNVTDTQRETGETTVHVTVNGIDIHQEIEEMILNVTDILHETEGKVIVKLNAIGTRHAAMTEIGTIIGARTETLTETTVGGTETETGGKMGTETEIAANLSGRAETGAVMVTVRGEGLAVAHATIRSVTCWRNL